MGIYQSPIFRNETSDKLKKGEEDWNEFAQFHIGFYPPLLRSATVKKFLVG